jgi:hypothetical protein
MPRCVPLWLISSRLTLIVILILIVIVVVVAIVVDSPIPP